MAVTFDVKDTAGLRDNLFKFNPAEIVIKPELNGRHDFQDLTELIEDIEKNGQLQPVTVRRENGKPVLAFGFRRYQAIVEINKKRKPADRMRIKAVYSEKSERDLFFANWSENHVRKQTTPLDDAFFFLKLKEDWGLSVAEIAERLNLKPSLITARIKLAGATPEVQKAVKTGRLKATAAGRLAKLSSEVQKQAVKGDGKVGKTQLSEATGEKPKRTLADLRVYLRTRAGEVGVSTEIVTAYNEILAWLEG